MESNIYEGTFGELMLSHDDNLVVTSGDIDGQRIRIGILVLYILDATHRTCKTESLPLSNKFLARPNSPPRLP